MNDLFLLTLLGFRITEALSFVSLLRCIWELRGNTANITTRSNSQVYSGNVVYKLCALCCRYDAYEVRSLRPPHASRPSCL